MNNPHTALIEEKVAELIEKVKSINSECAFEAEEKFAYQQGFQDAIAMFYIDLTGTPKTKGTMQATIDTVLEGENSYADGYKQGKFDAQMDLEHGKPVTNNMSYQTEIGGMKLGKYDVHPEIQGLTNTGNYNQALQDVLPVIERAVAAERLRLIKSLPEEMIVHSYMPSENTPARIGWNDYREAAIKALTPTQTK